MTRTAECACGRVHVSVESEPFLVATCHCDYCQKRTGSVFQVGAYFAPDEKLSVKGETKAYNGLEMDGVGNAAGDAVKLDGGNLKTVDGLWWELASKLGISADMSSALEGTRKRAGARWAAAELLGRPHKPAGGAGGWCSQIGLRAMCRGARWAQWRCRWTARGQPVAPRCRMGAAGRAVSNLKPSGSQGGEFRDPISPIPLSGAPR
jgi:Glutathione-dependent formaldehyde-activating enzyme